MRGARAAILVVNLRVGCEGCRVYEMGLSPRGTVNGESAGAGMVRCVV